MGSEIVPLIVTYPIFINRAIKSITFIYKVESFQHVCMHIHTIEHELEYVRHPYMKKSSSSSSSVENMRRMCIEKKWARMKKIPVISIKSMWYFEVRKLM